MFNTQINLPQGSRVQIAALLNQQLADLSDLASQTKQAHWNVRGRHFYPQHKLFEELAAGIDSHLDQLAERITSLGGYAMGTVRDAAAATRLDDFPADQGDDHGYIDVLSERFAHCANEVRLAIDLADELSDTATADLLTGICRDLDKGLWMLEAHMRPLQADAEMSDDDRVGARASKNETSRDGTSSHANRIRSKQGPAKRASSRRKKG